MLLCGPFGDEVPVANDHTERVESAVMNWNRYTRQARLNLGCGTIYLVLGATIAGCSSQKAPLQVQVTQVGPYQHAAKSPDCQMPVLELMPLRHLSQVAIVEVWADAKDQPPDVLPALQRKACETGADALVIINTAHQDIKNLLYAATPNQTMTDVTNKDAYAAPGDYIKIAEHTHRIGEAGHNGYYVDAVAINYLATDDHQPAGRKPSTVIDSIRTPHG
jgi:hypothetical protein